MGNGLPWLTTDQMIEVDRVMIEDLRIELIQMMENAGLRLAEVAIERFDPGSVIVCCGSGGNGGGGLVAARRLAVAGVDVQVLLTRPDLSGVPGHQLDICRRMGIPVLEGAAGQPDLWVDAVIGYSLRGSPLGRAAELIELMNASAAPTLSLDTPSGLDTSTGEPGSTGEHGGPIVAADATVTLAAPKVGLRRAPAVGDLYVADISVPPEVYVRLGFEPFRISGAKRVSDLST